MRKLIFIAAIVLVSATAHAAEPWRNLSLASNKGAEKAAESSQTGSIEKPAKQIEAPAITPQADAKPADTKSSDVKPTVVKPKRKRVSIEARVIYELHRAGYRW